MKLRPITYDEANEALDRMEDLARDLADSLRWAKEHGHPIGDALDVAEHLHGVAGDHAQYLRGAMGAASESATGGLGFGSLDPDKERNTP